MKYKIKAIDCNNAHYVEEIDANLESITNNGDLILLKTHNKNGKEEKDLVVAYAKGTWLKIISEDM